MAKEEKTILNDCLIALGKLRHVRAWRNNTGQAWAGRGVRLRGGQRIIAEEGDVLVRRAQPVRFGLPGSGDIIGIERVRVTSNMVGTDIGRMISVEVKAPKGKESDQQSKFRKMIQAMGGAAEILRDPADIPRIFGARGDE
ncbi:hypothetical protein [Sneathiella sp.]|uniref:hypothetical protein n=1 Tax=Sneathiella sp. TaxID=1964365 RepID=UPI002FE308B2